MEELAHGLESAANSRGDTDRLIVAAQKWAAWALENHRDEALAKALRISESIANYVSEIEQKA